MRYLQQTGTLSRRREARPLSCESPSQAGKLAACQAPLHVGFTDPRGYGADSAVEGQGSELVLPEPLLGAWPHAELSLSVSI